MLGRLADTYYTYKFLRLLTSKWEDVPAVKLGIIDSSGKKLKSPETSDEKEAYSPFIRLVVKLKAALEKIPFGKTTLAKYATALWLIKEQHAVDLEYPFTSFLKQDLNIDIEYPEYDLKESADPSIVYMFGEQFKKVSETKLELLEDVMTSGFDGTDGGFAGSKVFDCDTETFNKCRLGKTPYARYSTFVGSDDIGKEIRDYCVTNRKKPVILKDKATGAMLYLKRQK